MPSPSSRALHIERILFVVGTQNAGKSTALRSMFIDPRFGTRGLIPAQSRIKLVALSRERCLFVRLTSPHERNESVDEFFRTIVSAEERAARLGFRRLNLACAMQPFAANRMPDLTAVCTKTRNKFSPERMRIAIVDPRQDGNPGPKFGRSEIQSLRKDNVELIGIDGEHSLQQSPNGMILADYFDFT
ncbi:hypothetical protein [Bordetella genomosp. 13]|uniref:hypothetical protein n=1 Tax=Bordetella genomosp. 13 TaxID=463040 RepID=UPI0011A48BAD|nr:hypothetical protein [Bordetella genomosp. 13]